MKISKIKYAYVLSVDRCSVEVDLGKGYLLRYHHTYFHRSNEYDEDFILLKDGECIDSETRMIK